MKKFLLFLPILLLSCNKEKATSKISTQNDSVMVSDATVVDQLSDSLANGKVILKDENSLAENDPTFRVLQGNKIIKTINGDNLPRKISDEFTSADQQYLLKIKNFKGKKITAKIIPENPDMNIRFNQIKLANGDFDGPFGLNVDYNIPENGEIWLIISKSNMASGESKGKFTINLK